MVATAPASLGFGLDSIDEVVFGRSAKRTRAVIDGLSAAIAAGRAPAAGTSEAPSRPRRSATTRIKGRSRPRQSSGVSVSVPTPGLSATVQVPFIEPSG